MPLKLNIGLSRKVGEANYGSRGASVNVEIEVDSSLVNEPARLQEKIRQVFGLARASVADELNGTNGHGHASRHDNNGRHNGSNGNGAGHNGANGQRSHAARRATESQCKALFAITKSQGLKLKEVLRERFHVDKPEELSLKEASQLIDALQAPASNERR